jgi:predicted PurR-regulated permease PerM
MRKHSNYFELVLTVFIAAFVYLFQPIFEHLFASSVLSWLEKYMQISEAEVVARLAEVALPVCGSILLIVLLYRFLSREIERELTDEGARLRRRLADLRVCPERSYRIA